MHPSIGMLCEIGIERFAAFNATTIMFDDGLQGGKTAVVHIRRGHRDIAQRGCVELASVQLLAGRDETARVCRMKVEAIVVKRVITKKRTSMAMKAVRAKLAATPIILCVEQLEAALLLCAQFRFALQHSIEHCIV